MHIHPLIGLDDLHFGMAKSRVFERLGFPNKSYLTECECREVQYFFLRLVLKFEPENEDRLGWIEVHNRSAVVFGVSPWNMTQPEVIELFSRHLNEAPELEDYHSFESATFSSSWVELQFQFGSLSCINFGVPYDRNNWPIWPVEAQR